MREGRRCTTCTFRGSFTSSKEKGKTGEGESHAQMHTSPISRLMQIGQREGGEERESETLMSKSRRSRFRENALRKKNTRILNPKPCNSYLNSLIFCLIRLAVDSCVPHVNVSGFTRITSRKGVRLSVQTQSDSLAHSVRYHLLIAQWPHLLNDSGSW